MKETFFILFFET